MVTLARFLIFVGVLFCYSRSLDAADALFRERGVDHRDIPKLRAWVWEHWNQHRAGTATLRWVTVEGDSGASDYTVARNSEKHWYLSIHLQGTERPMFEGDAVTWRDEWIVAFSVNRVEEPYHDDWPGKPISRARPLPPRKFVLESKDKDEKIITHI